MNVLVCILEQLNLNVVFLALEHNLISSHVPQFSDEILAGLTTPAFEFSLQSGSPLFSTFHSYPTAALTGNWVLATGYCLSCPALNRFTYSRTAPGTPAGNCRKNAYAA